MYQGARPEWHLLKAENEHIAPSRHPGAGRDPAAPSVASFPGLFASLTLRAALWAFNALRAFVRPARNDAGFCLSKCH